MYDMGSRLKTIRKQRGLTQYMLARRIHKSVSAVSGYESNVQMLPLDILKSMACALNVSLDYLVGFDQLNSYSSNNLNTRQKELLDLLFLEFSNSTSNESALSPQQIMIIQKLIEIFLSK